MADWPPLPCDAWFAVVGEAPREGDRVFMVSAHAVSRSKAIGRPYVGLVLGLEVHDWMALAKVRVSADAEVELVADPQHFTTVSMRPKAAAAGG